VVEAEQQGMRANDRVAAMADACIASLAGGGKLLLCGDGGSAADAPALGGGDAGAAAPGSEPRRHAGHSIRMAIARLRGGRLIDRRRPDL
jgi:hypothetical protein